MAGPRSPTSPVTAQLISRRWKVFSSWSYAECQQRSNQQLVVLPQTRSSSFHGVENCSRLDGMKLFKNFQTYGRAVLPQTRPSFFDDVEEPFRLHVMQPLKPFKFMAGPRSPTSPVTAQLISQRWRIFSSWCYGNFQQRSNERLVVLPQTRSNIFHGVENIFSFGWYEAFQKRSSLCLSRALPNTAQFFTRCWRTFLSGCYAAI